MEGEAVAAWIMSEVGVLHPVPSQRPDTHTAGLKGSFTGVQLVPQLPQRVASEARSAHSPQRQRSPPAEATNWHEPFPEGQTAGPQSVSAVHVVEVWVEPQQACPAAQAWSPAFTHGQELKNDDLQRPSWQTLLQFKPVPNGPPAQPPDALQ